MAVPNGYNPTFGGIVTAAGFRSTEAPTSYLLPVMGVGVYGTPVVDTALVDNIALTSNMSTGTNKTSADTSCMAAFFGMKNTANTANNKLQGVLASTTVGFNCYDAYGVQGHITLADNATHAISSTGGTGNLCGVSAKATVAAGLTVTGTVSGLLVTVDGTGTVTGTHSGIWLDCVSSPDNALLISGSTYTNLLALSEGTAVVNSGTEASGNGVKLTIMVGSTPYYINAHPTSNN